MSLTIRVATDVGGTFTDLVCFELDGEHGLCRITTATADTTPPHFGQGVLHPGNAAEVDGYGSMLIQLNA